MRKFRISLFLSLSILLSLIRVSPSQASSGPALTVNASIGRHLISAYIYGINFADETLANQLSLPVRRWGGNATTRYNYLYDTANHASDWYFENIPNDNANPAVLPNGSDTDKFVEQDRRTGTKSILTLPLIGYVPNSRAYACGFSVAKYGAQQSTDPYRPDCGNGVLAAGGNVTGNTPSDTSIAAGPAYVQAWMQHLIGNYGTAANGGVLFYAMDNEADLWYDTHRDVHPNGATYDEMKAQTYSIAATVKATDPGAQILGPVGWGFLSLQMFGKDQQTCNLLGGSCWSNPPDRAAHGGVDFSAWYLQQMKAYDQANNLRILNYFDNHLYPQQNGVGGDATDAATDALRLRSTRQLWDPTYVDESWINQAIYFIPRMKASVAANYPGTKLAISEYDWGAHGDINGALAQADVLGIFGREGLDLATLWNPPTATQPLAYAFRMYRNYDGSNSKFGDLSVTASSQNQDQLAVYSAIRTSDKALTLMVINKDPANALTSSLSLSGFTPASSATVYSYSAANLNSIVKQPNLAVAANGFTTTYPAYSITLIIIPTAGPVPTLAKSIGIYNSGAWYLINNNNTAFGNTGYGASGWIPVVGDWNGDGITKLGIYKDGAWYLLGDDNATLYASFFYGGPGWLPVVGDWSGTGHAGMGIYQNGAWYLRNTLSYGSPDYSFYYGGSGWLPVVGDWSGIGHAGMGIYQNGAWYLRDSLSYGNPDHNHFYGAAGWTPVVGDWNGPSVAVARPAATTVHAPSISPTVTALPPTFQPPIRKSNLTTVGTFLGIVAGTGFTS